MGTEFEPIDSMDRLRLCVTQALQENQERMYRIYGHPVRVKLDALMPHDRIEFWQGGCRVGAIVNIGGSK